MGDGLNGEAKVRTALLAADRRVDMLRVVADLGLPDAWIAAGAIRNAVWDAMHCHPVSTPLADVDVIWFDPTRATSDLDRTLESRLSEWMPGVIWSVKNQARMHQRHGDEPYNDCLDAMRSWPETATAVGARLTSVGTIEFQTAFGFSDLLGLILRPTRPGDLKSPFWDRIAANGWLRTWPKLRVVP